MRGGEGGGGATEVFSHSSPAAAALADLGLYP